MPCKRAASLTRTEVQFSQYWLEYPSVSTYSLSRCDERCLHKEDNFAMSHFWVNIRMVTSVSGMHHLRGCDRGSQLLPNSPRADGWPFAGFGQPDDRRRTRADSRHDACSGRNLLDHRSLCLYWLFARSRPRSLRPRNTGFCTGRNLVDIDRSASRRRGLRDESLGPCVARQS
jgi:hypothetical protein